MLFEGETEIFDMWTVNADTIAALNAQKFIEPLGNLLLRRIG